MSGRIARVLKDSITDFFLTDITSYSTKSSTSITSFARRSYDKMDRVHRESTSQNWLVVDEDRIE